MAPAVFTALVATGLGFVALYTSPVTMIHDFGKMLTIVLVISFILGLFLFIPILFSRDYFFSNEKQQQKQAKKQINQEKVSKTDKALDWITKKTISFRWLIIIIVIATASFVICLDLDADFETDIETFMHEDTQAVQDIHIIVVVVVMTYQVSFVLYQQD